MRILHYSIFRLILAAGLANFASSIYAEEYTAADVLFDTIDRKCIQQIENNSGLDHADLKEVPALRQFQIFRFMSKTMNPEEVTLWQTSSEQVVIVEGNEDRSCYILAFEIEDHELIDAYQMWRTRNTEGLLVAFDIETQSDLQKRLGRHGVLAKLLDDDDHLEVGISSHYKNNNFITVFVARYPPNPISDHVFGSTKGNAENNSE
ncbi:hypothetical protein A9Q96_13115 [Rhodobacterales bacterium 52_120_T64]|nr:hypothetical protein A9Q96_13115 [Rhodobacterales bacterium 52_120_T64]